MRDNADNAPAAVVHPSVGALLGARVRRRTSGRSKRWDESAYSRTRATTRTRTIKTARRPYNAVSTRLRHVAVARYAENDITGTLD